MNEIIFKTEPSLMFITKKSGDGSRIICQNALEVPTYLKGISLSDKACIMGLQTLIGFQRYKADLRVSGAKTIESNGKNVYEQTYSTVTHSVNLNNLAALEEAGYIEIVSEEEEFNHYGIEKVFGIKPRPLKSLLIMEKIGFSNTQGLKQIFNAAKNGDKEELDSLKKTFKKVTFRLTDKEIDFEDIYKKTNGYTEFESKDEQKKLKRLRSIFFDSNSRIPGIYSDRTTKIDIKYDRFGRPFLDYKAKESFGEKIEKEQGITKIDRNIKPKNKEENSFEQDLKRGVDLQKFAEVSKSNFQEQQYKQNQHEQLEKQSQEQEQEQEQ
jgi:hypothetical protein